MQKGFHYNLCYSSSLIPCQLPSNLAALHTVRYHPRSHLLLPGHTQCNIVLSPLTGTPRPAWIHTQAVTSIHTGEKQEGETRGVKPGYLGLG